MDGKCKDCKFWDDERLIMWGKISDNFRICLKEKYDGHKMFVSADTTCSRWEKKE